MMSAHKEISSSSNVTYEDLAELEKEFDEAELDILRKETLLQAPLYEKRAALVSQIPNFWPLVLEQAPPDIDQFIQPTDSHVLATSLKSIDVTRFEIPPYIAEDEARNGSPRSVAFKFTFSPNEWFEDEVLEKKFWFRRKRGPRGWSGLVSEPVHIRWKGKQQDLTEGLTGAAYAAWKAEMDAESKNQEVVANGQSDGEGKSMRKGKPKGPELPEHRELDKRLERSTQGSLSFFTWFGYRGRHVTAEESAIATQEERERRERIKRGEQPPPAEAEQADGDDDGEIEDEGDFADLEREVFPGGDDLAISISEDLFPSALKYFISAQEEDRISEPDFEESGESEDEDDDADPNDGDVPDLRGLVSNSKKNPKKKKGLLGEDDDDFEVVDEEEEERPRKRRA